MNLNERVAKVKGYTLQDVRIETSFGSHRIGSTETYFTSPNGWEGHVDDLPDWSGDLNAAWELVKEMGGAFKNLRRNTSGFFYVEFWLSSESKWREASGEAPAEAICLAYLAWKGGKE